jgi:MinD-like ATPase involved in chromosome partitioning or flagellar assembly
MLTVVASGKAAPGVTTSTWALALSWPGELIVVDCDPAGGDMAAGLLAGRVTAARGLLSWSLAARRDVPALDPAALLAEHAVQLPEAPGVWLLAGFASAAQGASFTAEAWDRLASALERSSAVVERDVLVDAGRLVAEHGCWPLMRSADRVLLTVRRSVRSVHAAHGATQRLRDELGDLAKVSALVVGDGPYPPGEVAKALQLPLAGTLPEDRAAGQALSDGAPLSWTALQRSALLRAASTLAGTLTSTTPAGRLTRAVTR